MWRIVIHWLTFLIQIYQHNLNFCYFFLYCKPFFDTPCSTQTFLYSVSKHLFSVKNNNTMAMFFDAVLMSLLLTLIRYCIASLSLSLTLNMISTVRHLWKKSTTTLTASSKLGTILSVLMISTFCEKTMKHDTLLSTCLW